MTIPKKATDRRVARTRRQLRDALHSLIREKNYDDIVVKEILDRADVGRSAFYTHFRDKDELLASSIEDLLANVPTINVAANQSSVEVILWFSLPVFEHVEAQHAAGGLRMDPKGRSILHRRLKTVLTRLILTRAKKIMAASSSPLPADLIAAFLASTFVLVLDWWVDSKVHMSPKIANELFRKLVTPALQITE